jgi:hypothetical protein
MASLRYRLDTEGNSSSVSPADFAATFARWLDRYGDAWEFFVAEDGGHMIDMHSAVRGFAGCDTLDFLTGAVSL